MKKLAPALSLLFVAVPAFAQDVPQKGERIEITGSSIKRVQDEGALPVQVITRKDIEARGITSAEQLLMQISANGTGADNLSSNVGIQLGTTDRNNNGNSSANLRGLGAGSTLVLLNGRRVVTHGAKGNAVDLSSIPLAAVERVEVLKDGASALYGTDAIGGVINFILRRDYVGAEITGFVDATEKGGGNVYRGSLVAGWGDLAKNRWNLMTSINYDKQQILAAHTRSFDNGFQPDKGLAPNTAGAPFASQTGAAGTAIGATFTTPNLGTGTQTFNRANLLSFQGKCDSIQNMSQFQAALWASPGAKYACAYDYGGSEVLIQPVERTQGLGRFTFQVNNDITAFAEVIGTRTKATKYFEEYQITTTGSFLGMAYPVGGPFYQDLSQYIPSFNRNLPIAYRWRCMECGQRTIETTTDAYRALVGLEGQLMNRFDWKVGFAQSQSKADSILAHGYMYTDKLTTALASGQVNPWLLPGQTQTAAGMALLDAARADGAALFGGRSKLTQVDGAISGDLWNLPWGAIAAAVGFDYRKESYQFSDGEHTTPPTFQAPFDADFPKVQRTIKAVYGELLIPVYKRLETTLSVRHDSYSDFGGTTNPKVSIKWNPVDPVLVRSSYNEGFRAPSFFQLYSASGLSPIPGNVADPILCPGGPVAGSDLTVCSIRPNGLAGGNPDLKPETSKQWSIGLLVEPAQWASAGFDLWQIRRKGIIYELTPQLVIANYTTFPGNLVRGTDGRLDGPGGYIRAGFVNADGDITRGVDVTLRSRFGAAAARVDVGLDGTYIISHKSRTFITENWTEFVGQWNDRDLFPRWKHTAHFTYETGPWSGSLYQFFTSHYKDKVPTAAVPPGFDPFVKSYMTYTLAGSYTGLKNWKFSGGVKNLFDRDPPFTAHDLDFSAGAGWDPRVADPRGRAYYFSVTYKFL